MSAEIILLPIVRIERDGEPPAPGNGALEVVRDYLNRVNPARVMARSFLGKDENFEGLDELPDADHFLAWLWEQGFKIIPVDE